MKRLLEAAKRVAGMKAGECRDCNGHGRLPITLSGCLPSDHDRNCPTCARLREIAEFIWHEPSGNPKLCSCGNEANPFSAPDEAKCWRENPTFTIQLVRTLLEDLGEWEGFVRYCGMQTVIKKTEKRCGFDVTTFEYSKMQILFADILTSDKPDEPNIVEKGAEYLEGLS